MQQIKISESHAYYGDLHVLNNVSLSIDKGEIVSIIGPSGSGKSSLLKLLVGLLLPKSGTISISNKIIDYTNKAHLNYARNKTAIVFQQYNLFENMNVLKNVCIAPYKIQKRNKEEVEEQAIKLLDKVGLKNKLNSYPDELSGGQQQRVAIARAFACKAKVLFVDEPTGNLDNKTGTKISELLFEVNEESSNALVVVTHDTNLASKCDNQIELSEGSIA